MLNYTLLHVLKSYYIPQIITEKIVALIGSIFKLSCNLRVPQVTFKLQITPSVFILLRLQEVYKVIRKLIQAHRQTNEPTEQKHKVDKVLTQRSYYFPFTPNIGMPGHPHDLAILGSCEVSRHFPSNFPLLFMRCVNPFATVAAIKLTVFVHGHKLA